MSYLKSLSVAASTLALAACVTINVYFPAAAAEKAADKFIEDVWGREGGQPAAPESEPGAGLAPGAQPALGLLLELVVPAAHAAQGDIDISTPAIERIKASMQARHNQLGPYYDSGAVGLTDDGLVSVRDAGAIPLPERRTVNQLVAEENRDRNALYREIALANGNPGWEDDIRRTFARRWIDKAHGGWHYQSGGGWKRK